jgi:uncharacterized protein (DUF342 family)
MNVVRKELEFKKTPKAERTPEQEIELEKLKQESNAQLEKAKLAKETNEQELAVGLEESTVEVKGKLYTHVTVQYGDEKVTTKRTHGPSIFTFNQYEIKLTSMFEDEDLEQEA